MSYEKYDWQDGPEGDTPITADRLNHIEDGIAEHDVDQDPHAKYLFVNGTKKLTVNTLPPANPQIGDLWIEI